MMNDEGDQLQEAERDALDRLVRAEPSWNRLTRASELMPVEVPTLLHAGPPFQSLEEVPAPVLNSLVQACIYEGWGSDAHEARSMIDDGAVALKPAQDFGVVVPLAAAVSPTMYLAAVGHPSGVAGERFVPLHDGVVHGSLFGRMDEHFTAHRSWVDGELATWLQQALVEPIPVLPLLARSLMAGDDGHSRVLNGSRYLVEVLGANSSVVAQSQVSDFLDGSPGFALNIWMASAAVMLSLLEGIPGSGMVTRAGGNGVRFGVQVAGAPGVWITETSPVIAGPLATASGAAEGLPAIGDSAVIDFLGLGGQTTWSAPAVRDALGDVLPDYSRERPSKFLRTAHPLLGGRPVVTDAFRALHTGTSPLVLLGILDRAGVMGRIGGGVAEPPLSIFDSAQKAVAIYKQEVHQG